MAAGRPQPLVRQENLRASSRNETKRYHWAVEDIPRLGLWGTRDPDRVSVSLELDDPLPIIGYVRYDGSTWGVEGDPQRYQFKTPREAAEYGFATVWRDINPSLARGKTLSPTEM